MTKQKTQITGDITFTLTPMTTDDGELGVDVKYLNTVEFNGVGMAELLYAAAKQIEATGSDEDISDEVDFLGFLYHVAEEAGDTIHANLAAAGSCTVPDRDWETPRC